MSNRWTDILTPEQISDYHALTADLDPSFARKQREFYESRSAAQCDSLAHQSWLCNESDAYQLARSYAAMKRAA
jgi:hypothetical protein